MSLWSEININNNKLKVQINDFETINLIDNVMIQDKFLLEIKEKDLLNLEKYIPKIDIYNNKELYFSIHGIMHTIRVMFYSLLISKILNFDYSVPIFIASLHDIGRENDNEDIEHGKRASNYFLENIEKFKEFKQQKDIISFCLENHNLNIEKQNIYLNILKTADALDRFRLPKIKWWTNTVFIPFKFFNYYLSDFKKFICETEREFLINKKEMSSMKIIKNNIKYINNICYVK